MQTGCRKALGELPDQALDGRGGTALARHI
jgi:hypothetical protein